jgi:hypothetical protein
LAFVGAECGLDDVLAGEVQRLEFRLAGGLRLDEVVRRGVVVEVVVHRSGPLAAVSAAVDNDRRVDPLDGGGVGSHFAAHVPAGARPEPAQDLEVDDGGLQGSLRHGGREALG